MNINISLSYEEKKITSSFSVQEIEVFSQTTWEELYRKAQLQPVPFYIVACAITRLKESPQSRCYDGISFYKYSKNSTIDPTTRLKIEQVRYLFFKCHQFSHTDDDIPTFPLSLAQVPGGSYKNYLSDLVDDAVYSDIFFDSLIVIGSEIDRERLAKRQWIIGSKLLNDNHVKDGLRWIWCAAENQLTLAQREIGLRALNLSETSPLNPSIEQAEKWLTLAANQGDQIAQQLLDDLQSADSDKGEDVDSSAILQPSSPTVESKKNSSE